MKSKDLIEVLKDNPEYEINVSVDAYDITGKDEDKIYANSCIEPIVENSRKAITLHFEDCNINFKINEALEVNTKDTKSCWNELYMELLHAVETKFSDETRHETALKYIKQAESGDSDSCSKHEPK